MNYSKEEKIELIQATLGLLKQNLKETGMGIGFDKITGDFIFFDRRAYINTKKFKDAFKVNIDELIKGDYYEI